MRIVVMGPSGSGKSVVGAAVALGSGAEFIDGDDLHPEANIAKMSAGQPLDDEDRGPWLDAIAARLNGDGPVVVACSALARRYRDRIRAGAPDARFIALDVPAEELARRMAGRTHFMPPALLASQLAALQPLDDDEPGVTIAADRPLEEVVAAASEAIAGWTWPDQSLR